MFNKNIGYFKTKGIGIGLSTAKNLSNALLGGIHLNSTFGKGTEVGFSVLTQRNNQRVNSKDLKVQARIMKEDNSLCRMGTVSFNSGHCRKNSRLIAPNSDFGSKAIQSFNSS